MAVSWRGGMDCTDANPSQGRRAPIAAIIARAPFKFQRAFAFNAHLNLSGGVRHVQSILAHLVTANWDIITT
jgi:hypothetical protein